MASKQLLLLLLFVWLAGLLSIFETANKLWEWKQATHTHSRVHIRKCIFGVRVCVCRLVLSIELLKYFVIFLNHHKFELVLPRHLAVGHQRDKNFPNDGNINKLEMLNSTLFGWAAAQGQAAGPVGASLRVLGPQNLLSACCGIDIAVRLLAACQLP